MGQLSEQGARLDLFDGGGEACPGFSGGSRHCIGVMVQHIHTDSVGSLWVI